MNRDRSVLHYLLIPFVIALMVGITLYFALLPIFRMTFAVSGMVISKCAPDFNEKLHSIYDAHAVRSSEFVEESEFTMPVYETYYARLSCKRIGLNALVFWGDSDKVLKQGVGQYIGSFMPGYGKPLLMGAHSCTYFEPLEAVQKGDIFEITTNYGVFQYKVTETKVARARDVSAYDLTKEEEQLILYTCYPFKSLIGMKEERFFVYADKTAGPRIIEERGSDDGMQRKAE